MSVTIPSPFSPPQVYDVAKKYCTHSFKGHKGSVTLVTWHPHAPTLQVVSAGDDCKILVWDLRKNACVARLADHLRYAQWRV